MHISDQDASGSPPVRVVPGTSIWAKAPVSGPGPAGVMTIPQLALERLWVSQEELGRVAGVKEGRNTVLRLLPLQPDFG